MCKSGGAGNSVGEPAEGNANFTTRYTSRRDVANAYADTMKIINKGTPEEYEIYAGRTDIFHNGPNSAENKTNNNMEQQGVTENYNEGKLQIKGDYLGELALFDVVYACRNGNGAINSKDGSRYKGVGFIHLTGKGNYQNIYDIWKSKHPNHDTIKSIEDFAEALKTNVEVSIEASMIYWYTPKSGLNGNLHADLGDYDAVTEFVNGGAIDKEKRETYTKKAIEEFNNE